MFLSVSVIIFFSSFSVRLMPFKDKPIYVSLKKKHKFNDNNGNIGILTFFY